MIERRNMKKTILILSMIVAVNVEAKVVYTDYTFEGYTYEEKQNTDIFKYEKIKKANEGRLYVDNTSGTN